MLVMGLPETEGLTQVQLDYLNETVYDRCRCVRESQYETDEEYRAEIKRIHGLVLDEYKRLKTAIESGDLSIQAEIQANIIKGWLPEMGANVLRDALETLDNLVLNMGLAVFNSYYPYTKVTSVRDDRISGNYCEEVSIVLSRGRHEISIFGCDNKGDAVMYDSNTGLFFVATIKGVHRFL